MQFSTLELTLMSGLFTVLGAVVAGIVIRVVTGDRFVTKAECTARSALMFFVVMDILRAFLLARVFVYAKLCRNNAGLTRFFFGWVERVRHLEAFCMQLDKKRTAI
jgi:hypothetical protein